MPERRNVADNPGRTVMALRPDLLAPTSSRFHTRPGERGIAMRNRRAWTMPADEARTFLQQLQERIASSEIEVTHCDTLIRLRSIIEEDLDDEASDGGFSAPWREQQAA